MKEITQFARFVYEQAVSSGMLSTLKGKAEADLTVKDKALLKFHGEATSENALSVFGGLSNIRAVRVLAAEGADFVLSYTLIFDPRDLIKRQAQADERKARDEAQSRSKKTVASKPRAKQPQGGSPKKAFLLSPQGKDAAYDAALKQRSENNKRKPQVTQKPTVKTVKSGS